MRKDSIPPERHISRLTDAVLLATIGTIATAALLCGEPFNFVLYPFSALSGLRTIHGFPNGPGAAVFGTGMLVSWIMCARLWLAVERSRFLSLKTPRLVFLAACGVGYLIMIIPYDISAPVHDIGAGLLVGGLWFYDNALLYDLKRCGRRTVFWVGEIFLQTTVLPYAVFFLLNIPMREALQKIALLGLIIVIKTAQGRRLSATRSAEAAGAEPCGQAQGSQGK